MKYKITYLDYGNTSVSAIIVNLVGFYDLQNVLTSHTISDSSIIQIQRIFDAEACNIIDCTKSDSNSIFQQPGIDLESYRC